MDPESDRRREEGLKLNEQANCCWECEQIKPRQPSQHRLPKRPHPLLAKKALLMAALVDWFVGSMGSE
jgi:hypothetical protein